MDHQQVEQIVDELTHRYVATFTSQEVREVVETAVRDLEQTAAAGPYLPVFIRRFALEQVEHRATTRGADPYGAHDVLFVCPANAGPSQIAAGLANELGGGRVRAWSAGVRPAEQILPAVNQVMSERGVALLKAFPKPVTPAAATSVERIVTINVDGTACALPSTRVPVTRWEVDLGTGRDLDDVRRARDQIEGLVGGLLDELLV
ncbi:low molecular weight phosphatase family protein [Ornithinimicrobium tianjinense]|uniref:Phosphotyrosine protein phosphatase I domain-containing protein n=1 Tax=Ornithinimicrobium tianjinense TaxID=1195761 RepID=A0A917F714_9MICO|nr:hypothetical protein [Ornithinimicrobium tianjinense]GGF56991.1 hypothetical protein GCM10011366_26010 [Ornithinimicrobium tianjinense]